jgi:hypothetical protein
MERFNLGCSQNLDNYIVTQSRSVAWFSLTRMREPHSVTALIDRGSRL